MMRKKKAHQRRRRKQKNAHYRRRRNIENLLLMERKLLEITKVLPDEANEHDDGEYVIGEKGRKKKKREKHRELVVNGEEVVDFFNLKQIDFDYDDKEITKVLPDEANEHDDGEDVIDEKVRNLGLDYDNDKEIPVLPDKADEADDGVKVIGETGDQNP
ncbi:hypothetical protein C5167_037272 [Papaver somniferum]|uniref:Uncharacterized protein n=1 Tax=Papaver somniferum TaxID=3469 RepID=A0A4Y7I5X9_PAPSO|nr:hypothetical protein C5167_037272 [Papaver somniferum]